MRAISIYTSDQDELFPWRVRFSPSIFPNDYLRDWLKENITDSPTPIPGEINYDQTWQYVGLTVIKFQRHEDALLCFVRFA